MSAAQAHRHGGQTPGIDSKIARTLTIRKLVCELLVLGVEHELCVNSCEVPVDAGPVACKHSRTPTFVPRIPTLPMPRFHLTLSDPAASGDGNGFVFEKTQPLQVPKTTRHSHVHDKAE